MLGKPHAEMSTETQKQSNLSLKRKKERSRKREDEDCSGEATCRAQYEDTEAANFALCILLILERKGHSRVGQTSDHQKIRAVSC